MSTTTAAAVARPAAVRHAPGVLRVLAVREARRYATHPVFLVALAGNVAIAAMGPDPRTSSVFHAIVPAAGFGLLGIVTMWLIARRSDRAVAAAGSVPVGERTRTAALALATVVPFAAGLAWWIWAMVTYRVSPPPADGFPFGEADRLPWVGAVLFALGPLAAVGGPMIGLLTARYTTGRAAPALVAVGVVAVTIVMQGIFEPLRRVRVVMPWTYWGGPEGTDRDPDAMVIFPGSPYWWVPYVACVIALGVVVALLHDRERPRRTLIVTGAAIVVLAVAFCLLAMWTGTDGTVVNTARHTT